MSGDNFHRELVPARESGEKQKGVRGCIGIVKGQREDSRDLYDSRVSYKHEASVEVVTCG